MAKNLTAAVANYPEGAGHATRMLSIGRGLEDLGVKIHMGGGGPGSKFVEANGYEYHQPKTVDYIGDFQDGGNLFQVISSSIPHSTKRIYDFKNWFKKIDPDFLVTDDVFAAAAAYYISIPVYFVTHNTPGFYSDHIEYRFTKMLTKFQNKISRMFFYPTVWPKHSVDPNGVIRTPPLALDGQDQIVDGEDIDILLIPSFYSEDFSVIADNLRDRGRSIAHVGSDNWETVPSLLPYIRKASIVVCSGYSTIMEATVGKTPCIIYPFTNEQRGVARVISESKCSGYRIANSVKEVVKATENPPSSPTGSNGSNYISNHILNDLS